MCVLPPPAMVVLGTNVDGNVTRVNHFLFPGPHDFGVFVVRQGLQHGTSQKLVRMKGSVVGDDSNLIRQKM